MPLPYSGFFSNVSSNVSDLTNNASNEVNVLEEGPNIPDCLHLVNEFFSNNPGLIPLIIALSIPIGGFALLLVGKCVDKFFCSRTSSQDTPPETPPESTKLLRRADNVENGFISRSSSISNS